MKLIIGLGNPGNKYQKTRHNIGFLTIEMFRNKLSDNFSEFSQKNKFKAEISEGNLADHKIILVKPQAYMNNSGQTISLLTVFYKIKPDDIYIIYDDLDLEPGQIKISQNKSSGGHNGIQSIIESLGNSNFCRFRIGIGKPKLFQSTPNFVLNEPKKSELKKILNGTEQIINGLELTIKKGILSAQTKYNQSIK